MNANLFKNNKPQKFICIFFHFFFSEPKTTKSTNTVSQPITATHTNKPSSYIYSKNIQNSTPYIIEVIKE